MTISHTRLRPSFTFTEERLAKLKEVAPEAFADGHVNWPALREALGDWLEEEGDDAEHFGLFWPGKRAARRVAATPPEGTLVPVPGEGVDEVKTKNVFIEGENLEVLKLLQKSYAGRVKMIYIDPPYNTGNDFVYEDDYSEPIETYLRRTNQLGVQGETLTTNTRSDGRFHSKWLSMIYPRLRVARSLLRDDGLLFVSIDDNEAANLRLLADEVFGPENFVAAVAWEKRFTRSNNARLFYSLKDTILIYRRSADVAILREPRTEKANSIYSNPDEDPRGPWTSSSYVNPATKAERPNLSYPLLHPVTGKKIEHPTHAWKYERSEYERHVRENRLWWGKKKEAKFPRLKVFLSEAEGGLVPIDVWDYKSTGTTDEGGAELKDLFGEVVFDNPKPTKLVRRMLDLGASTDEVPLIMDFFAGSCSTADAILRAARDKGLAMNFIMVQMPEPTGRKDFPSIADIGKERIRRIIKLLKKEAKPGEQEDLGFRVYRLQHSNLRSWKSYDGRNPGTLASLFEQDTLSDTWTPESLLTEVMLLEGFGLDSRITQEHEHKRNVVTRVTSDRCEHALHACFDEKVYAETIRELVISSQDVFVCLDGALSDTLKVGLADRCQLKTI